MVEAEERLQWRLLPSEQIRWSGARATNVPRRAHWRALTSLLFVLALISALFAMLIQLGGLSGTRSLLTVAGYLTLGALASAWAPRYLEDACRYLVTDRRVLWRRGRLLRSLDVQGLSYGRIHWHPSAKQVGHLELVRAVPFGPLARRQRLILWDIEAPDRVFAAIRGVTPAPNAGDSEVSLVERLDDGEQVVWGGHPEGWLIGWREALTAAGGLALVFIAVRHGHQIARILLGWEEEGLPVLSWAWWLLFAAGAITAALVLVVGAGLLWHGTGRSRRLGRDTEYVLTDRRIVIRRGRTELSVGRKSIVDVAFAPGHRGLSHLFLVLDAPQSRALADSGALSPWIPSRAAVPPVLFELREAEAIRETILQGKATRAPS